MACGRQAQDTSQVVDGRALRTFSSAAGEAATYVERGLDGRRIRRVLCCRPEHVRRRDVDDQDEHAILTLPRYSCSDLIGLRELLGGIYL
uniref:Uncharacterized protein n=1 Tax=Oryza brachyantha TaxID=4533 RepID=J3M1H7_ORYBR